MLLLLHVFLRQPVKAFLAHSCNFVFFLFFFIIIISFLFETSYLNTFTQSAACLTAEATPADSAPAPAPVNCTSDAG